MGCHTWFYRPVKEDELEVFRQHAVQEAWELFGDTDENKRLNLVNLGTYNKVVESVKTNTDYWWECGYGTSFDNKIESTAFIEGKLYLNLADPIDPIFPELKRYHDVFRVKHYPRKVIHNRHELRKWMGKRYFDLEAWQLEAISEFFRENPDGIITFG